MTTAATEPAIVNDHRPCESDGTPRRHQLAVLTMPHPNAAIKARAHQGFSTKRIHTGIPFCRPARTDRGGISHRLTTRV